MRIKTEMKTITIYIKGSGCLTEGFKKIQEKGNRNYIDLIARDFWVISFQSYVEMDTQIPSFTRNMLGILFPPHITV